MASNPSPAPSPEPPHAPAPGDDGEAVVGDHDNGSVHDSGVPADEDPDEDRAANGGRPGRHRRCDAARIPAARRLLGSRCAGGDGPQLPRRPRAGHRESRGTAVTADVAGGTMAATTATTTAATAAATTAATTAATAANTTAAKATAASATAAATTTATTVSHAATTTLASTSTAACAMLQHK